MNVGPIRPFFLSSYRVNVTSCNLCARAKVPGHRELQIEQNPSLVKFNFSFNGDGVIQQNVRKGLERKAGRQAGRKKERKKE